MAAGKKTGGRNKGTSNKVTSAVRLAIEAADPNGFLIHVMNTGKIKTTDPDTNQVTYEDVSGLERIRAAQHLSRKITPDAKEDPIKFDVGAIESVEDARHAMGAVIAALGKGELTPSAANAVCGVIQHYIKAYEVGEMSKELAEIEAMLIEGGLIKKGRSAA